MRWMALTLAVAFGAAACGEAELEEVPETAEVESDDDMGDLELDEETVIGADDVGEDLMATGWVAGMPLPNGFFLRTEDDRVIFVETDESVEMGQEVRVAGPLVATEATVFEGWEGDAFETGFEAEWDVETVVYIDAFMVDTMTGEAGMNGNGENGATAPAGGDTSDDMETDPGSKSG